MKKEKKRLGFSFLFFRFMTISIWSRVSGQEDHSPALLQPDEQPWTHPLSALSFLSCFFKTCYHLSQIPPEPPHTGYSSWVKPVTINR